MTDDAMLASLGSLCGILPSYHDMQGTLRVTSPDTYRALLHAIGVEADSDSAVRESLTAMTAEAAARRFPEEVIVESGKPYQLAFGAGSAWSVCLEDSPNDVARGDEGGDILLPPLASGIYELSVHLGQITEVVRILAAPRQLTTVEAMTGTPRLWGINLALYGLRSGRNSGLGDYQDLAQLVHLAGEAGAAFVGINPIHNMGFFDDTISPYSPSHRGFLNTSHIALDAIPGLEKSAAARHLLATEASQFVALRKTPEVSYRPHKDMHNRLLMQLHTAFMEEADAPVRDRFASFAETAGQELATFATFETLSGIYGPDWRNWPDTSGVEPDPAQVEFHMWLQWVADHQVRQTQSCAKDAGLSLGLYLDLAVGPRRSGAESWCEQPSIAQGVSIGAPPDHLSPEGQNWSLSAFAPRKLQQANYRPLRRILTQVMRHAGVIRIDHVLGLARSFLIPDTGAPGGYIAQPLQSLIALIKIEAERHNCIVIGEDLGLVPEGFRDVTRGHGFYGYSVLQYEKTDDGQFRNVNDGSAQVLSCFATHDTPTVKGFETGCDIEWWQHLGWIDEERAQAAREGRSRDVADLQRLAGPAPDFRSSVHAILAASPASMVSVQLDDILGAVEAQNLPGTIDEHPNWRRKCIVPVEDLGALQDLQALSHTMTSARPAKKKEALHDS